MNKIEKPVFSADELDSAKTKMSVGFPDGTLIMGHNFTEAPKNKFQKTVVAAKERVNGIAHKRNNHAEINKIGYALFMAGTNEIWFGAKINYDENLDSFGGSVADKYFQLLGYYLQDAGWVISSRDKQSGDFIITLNAPANLENFRILSSSIGFVSNCRPDTEDIKRAESAIKYLNRKQRMILNMAKESKSDKIQ